MEITHQDIERYMKGQADPTLRLRVLREVVAHPGGEAACYLSELKRRLRLALDTDWSEMITIGSYDVDNPTADTSEHWQLDTPSGQSGPVGPRLSHYAFPIPADGSLGGGITPWNGDAPGQPLRQAPRPDATSPWFYLMPATLGLLLIAAVTVLISRALDPASTSRSSRTPVIAKDVPRHVAPHGNTDAAQKPVAPIRKGGTGEELWSESLLADAFLAPSERDVYRRLADDLDAWRTATLARAAPEDLENKFRGALAACDRLLNARFKPLTAEQLDQLRELCQRWRAGFVADINELREGEGAESVRRKTDRRVGGYITELLEPAKG